MINWCLPAEGGHQKPKAQDDSDIGNVTRSEGGKPGTCRHPEGTGHKGRAQKSLEAVALDSGRRAEECVN